MADGREEQVPCRKGRGGIVALVKVAKSASEPEGTQHEHYSDGTTMWWRWYAPTEPVNTAGFIHREEVARLLGYKPQYSFKGFGEDKSGLSRLTEDKFKSLLSAYTSKTIEKDKTAVQHLRKPANFGPGGEGPEHLALKEYVARNPSGTLGEPGLRLYAIEMPLPTADKIDIVLQDRFGRFVAVEIEVECHESELAGPLQCSKYRALLSYLFDRPFAEVRTILVAHSIHKTVGAQCHKHGIETKVVQKQVISEMQLSQD